MDSRTWLNLLLLIMVIALGLFVASRPSGEASSELVTPLHRDEIHRIVIPRSKGDIILKKIDGRWHMQSPYKHRAHEFRIGRLLDLATSTVEKHYDIDELDIKTFGIDSSDTHIRFNNTVLTYGDTHPVNKKRYVQVNRRLLLIDDELTPLIKSQPSSFADLSLLDESQKISRIELPDITLYRNAQGFWETDPPASADADSVQSLVDHWQTAQAFGVHAYMKRKQLGSIRLHLQDDSMIELLITDTSPWLILGRQDLGIEYHFDSSFKDKLLHLQAAETGNTDA